MNITTLAVTVDESYVNDFWKFTAQLRRTYKKQLNMSPVFYIDQFDVADSSLENANLVILLLSEDFLIELDTTIESELEKKKGQFIPVVLRTCSWKDDYPFSSAKETIDKPINKYADKDEAWFSATAAIERSLLKKWSQENH